MPDNKPPFTVTDRLVVLIADICEQIGKITMKLQCSVNQHQRRENRIRTIHSSLAIEHNTLTIDQVTAIIDGKHVLGNPSEIKDMENVSRSTDQVSDQDDNISRLTIILGDKEMSAAEIMNELGLSHRPTFRKNYLAPALEKGIIERTIPDRPNSKKQKYRKVK